jgi:hypothetical protein
MSQIIKLGDVVRHVHPAFSGIELYVVKKLDDRKYKCRFLISGCFGSDEFDETELFKELNQQNRRGPGFNAFSNVR